MITANNLAGLPNTRWDLSSAHFSEEAVALCA